MTLRANSRLIWALRRQCSMFSTAVVLSLSSTSTVKSFAWTVPFFGEVVRQPAVATSRDCAIFSRRFFSKCFQRFSCKCAAAILVHKRVAWGRGLRGGARGGGDCPGGGPVPGSGALWAKCAVQKDRKRKRKKTDKQTDGHTYMPESPLDADTIVNTRRKEDFLAYS